jgi:glycosyltransferase involved in cell wall biosynthesis
VKFGKCFFDEEKAKLQDILINNSDVIIVGNPEDKNELHDFYSKDLNIVILPNPINSSFISNSTELISERKNIFLFVGRFIRSKGILTIFQAIPKILNKYQDITFVFIGGHGDEDITEQLNLIGGNHPKNIIIQPWLSKIDLANFYLSAKAVVMPSLYEPFGNVAIECMASGSLLISTRIGGLNVITKNGKHALTIPLEDSTALALTIIDIAKNSKKYDGFALSGKDTVIRRFNPQKVVGEYMKYLLKGSYD